MSETIERCRDLLVARLTVFEDELRLAEARYKEREGDYHYVTLENVAIFGRQVKDIQRVKAEFENADLSRFRSVAEFKEFALARLHELYEARAMLRSCVRMIMEVVRDM